MESIYNLIPREEFVEKKIYKKVKAKKPTNPITGSTFGCRGSTRPLGAGVVEKRDGALFGPHSVVEPKYKPQQTKALVSPTSRVKRLPGLPNKSERPIMGLKTNKNFITANAVEAILQVPMVPEQQELNYLEKEDYGKVPEYLGAVKEEIRRENEMIDKYVKEQMGIEDEVVEEFEEMDERDREQLIKELKMKWEELNSKYQKITHLVVLDTAGQVRRKEQLEAALTEIENDVKKLSRPGPILLKK